MGEVVDADRPEQQHVTERVHMLADSVRSPWIRGRAPIDLPVCQIENGPTVDDASIIDEDGDRTAYGRFDCRR